jgi:hypothetical protein
MEAASKASRILLESFSDTSKVDEALLLFTRQLEIDYEDTQDIAVFIFGLRAFFCWPRAAELIEDPQLVARVRQAWLEQNDQVYTKWLSSANDDHEILKWSKWTFQAKNSLLTDFLAGIKA